MWLYWGSNLWTNKYYSITILTEFNSFPPGKFFILFVVCWFFSKSMFSKNSFRNTIWVSNRLDPYQARHFVGPDLDPICLQRLWTDDTLARRQWVKATWLSPDKSCINIKVTINPWWKDFVSLLRIEPWPLDQQSKVLPTVSFFSVGQ